MIDEELYQQAADELNSDKRRPHIWAKACALASDDHDEARYLYTNLRVEELQEQRQQTLLGGLDKAEATPAMDRTLELEALEDGLSSEESVEQDQSADIPSSISAPSGVDQLANKDATGELLRLVDVDSEEPAIESIERTSFKDQFSLDDTSSARKEAPAQTPSTSMEIPEVRDLDDTYESADDTIDAFRQEIEAVKASQNEEDVFLDTAAFSRQLDPEELISATDNNPASDEYIGELDRTTELSAEDIANLTHPEPPGIPEQDINDPVYHSADESMTNNPDWREADNFTQSDSTLDEVLDDALYVPPEPVNPMDDSMEWLDESANPTISNDSPSGKREPVVYEGNALVDDMEQQIDALNGNANPEPVIEAAESSSLDTIDSNSIPAAPALDDFSDEAADTVAASVGASAGAIAVAGAGGIASHAADYTANETADETGNTGSTAIYDPADNSYTDEAAYANDAVALYPLDLTDNGRGRQYAVYRRNNSAQAVKRGVSWSALIMTLPFLVYRHLFGTALMYCLMGLVTIGGLIISGLIWFEAGSSAAPLIKTCTLCFGILAFLGLIYLPFQHGNRWRGQKLEKRGYELIAYAKARSPGKAIARVRNASGFN